jgi:hypothetical protein
MQLEVWAQSVALTLKELLDPLAARVAALEQHDATMAGLMARVVALEARAPVPGPPGPPGSPGPAGRDGVDGKDGALEDRFTGRYVAGKAYQRGDLVTEDGSTFIRLETSDAPGRPGKSAGWQIFAMRGDRGRDGGHP